MSSASNLAPNTSLWAVNNPTGERGLIAIDKLGDAIRFFDPDTLAEQKVIQHKNHHELAISPDHRLAYASEFGKFKAGDFVESGSDISVLDLERQEIVDRISTGEFKGPHGMKFDADGHLWVIFEETGELGLIDTGRMKLAETFNIGAAGQRPPFIEMMPDASKLYVSCKSGNVIVFDMVERRVVATVSVPVGTEGIAISPGGDKVYVVENSRQDLLCIDTSTDRITETIKLKGAVLSSPKTSRLIRLRFSPDGKYLLSANYASGVVHIHDATNPAEHVMVAVAKGPQGIAFNSDSSKAIIANHDCGLITRLDLATASATHCVDAGSGIEALSYY